MPAAKADDRQEWLRRIMSWLGRHELSTMIAGVLLVDSLPLLEAPGLEIATQAVGATNGRRGTGAHAGCDWFTV